MSATQYMISVQAAGAATAASDISRVGYAIDALLLIQTRYLAAQVQVARAETQLLNLELTRENEEIRMGETERKLIDAQNGLQISTERMTYLTNELSKANDNGTATSYQYQQASVLLMAAQASRQKAVDEERKYTQQLTIEQNTLAINTNNLAVQNQILALDTQRVNDYAAVMLITQINVISTFIQLGAQLYLTYLAYQLKAAAAAEAAAAAGVDATAALEDAAANEALAAALKDVAVSGTAASVPVVYGAGGAAAGAGGSEILAGIAAGGLTVLEILAAIPYILGGLLGPNPSGYSGLPSSYGSGQALQYGGIVTSPTMAMIGEHGPEMVSPVGAGGGATVNVHIGGGIIGGSTEELAEQIGEVVNRQFDRLVRSNT